MSLAESFAQSGFAQFVNSLAGRIVRILAGLALIGWGYSQRAGAEGISSYWSAPLRLVSSNCVSSVRCWEVR